jgi:hypothetical protein
MVAGLGLTLLSGAPAQAALISTDACDNATLTQPFSSYGDTAQYKVVPGGSFTGTSTSWTLSHGARVVSGAPSGGSSSVYLPAGASVQSPYTCVDAANPTFRFFGRNDGLLSTMAAQVVYKLPLLGAVAVPVGVFALNGTWQPSAQMLTASVVLGLLSGGTTQVAIRFTEVLGASQVDDVYVDPRMHGG